MIKTSTIRKAALGAGTAPLALIMMLGAAPAFAQDASGAAPPAAAAGDTDADAGATIVITGTRIASPNLTSPIPVTSITGEEFFKTSQVSIGDQLNELPSLRSSFSTQNSTEPLGTAGLNLLDLRGLGTQRTLVLVNGRRYVASDILNNGVSVDINNIPTDLIERTDIVTGGESAVYGSDAIAGVVNFILKDHYEGIQARAQGGTSTHGDAGSYYGSILAGKNFSEGRGNIAVNLEYSHQTDYYGSERSNLASQNAFVTVDTDPSDAVNGSDGVPDHVFLRDVRYTSLANGGLVSFASPTGACGNDASGAAFNCTFLFNSDGTLVPQTGQRVGLAPNGSFLGGNGTNLREGKQLVLQPRQDRYNANLIGHYEFSRAFVPFVEASFSHVHTTGSQSGPAFFQGTTLAGFIINDADDTERPRLDNPFLSAQARDLITSQLIASGTAAGDITDATRFSLRENLLDLGVRNEVFKRDTYRIVAGVRGDFGSNWHYEVSGNYGHFKETNLIEGNLNVQRFFLAMDATRNPAGQIVCRSQLDPSSAAMVVDDPARLASDIAACVPVNLFGSGNVSDAARNYLVQDTVSHGKITQAVASGFIRGDSSQWFELPGGPIGVVLGGEYRRETNSYDEDPLVESGYTFYNAIAGLHPPSFVVKEGFGELSIPLLRDLPLLKELTLSGAGRIANYKGSTGTVYAYNGNLVWKPISDLTIRGGYSRAVRAPNLIELYSEQSQNYSPNFQDPCSARNIGTGSANRAANCAAAGIPAGYDYVYTQSLEITSGGNPNLKAEKSDSYTLGAIYSPSYIRGLSISVDYYDITVNNVIDTVDAQTIANQCYDSPSLDNSFCPLFQRAGAGGGPAGEVPYQILEGSLLSSSLNYAKKKARGIDFDVSYRHRFDFGDVSSHLMYTHVLQRDDFLDPTNPSFRDRILGELGDPKDSFTWSTDFKRGKFTANYTLRFISHMFLDTYEDLFPLNGLPPQNLDYADRRYYPAVFYHNVRFGMDVSDRFNIYLGVDNLTDRAPPFGLTGVGDQSGIYDTRGRYIYTGLVAKF